MYRGLLLADQLRQTKRKVWSMIGALKDNCFCSFGNHSSFIGCDSTVLNEVTAEIWEQSGNKWELHWYWNLKSCEELYSVNNFTIQFMCPESQQEVGELSQRKFLTLVLFFGDRWATLIGMKGAPCWKVVAVRNDTKLILGGYFVRNATEERLVYLLTVHPNKQLVEMVHRTELFQRHLKETLGDSVWHLNIEISSSVVHI